MENNKYDNYGGMSLKNVVLAMRDLRDKHTSEKAAAAITWAEHEHLSKTLLPEMMEAEGLTTIVLDGIGRLEIRYDASCSTPKENKEEVYQWMRDNGYEELIVGTINASTFKAQIKKFMKDGEDFPFDLINFNPYENAVLIRVK